jgi:SAM-dependent methyltransferase
MSAHNPTGRFSNRVADYVRYRPRYPAQVIEVLIAESGLTSAAVIADIGSGTGFSAEMFLQNGNTLYGVEPNSAMRAAGEQILADYPNFISTDGSAEATSLADQSIDYVIAGQAFHWFDRSRARAEFMRILKPDGWVVLFWNTRRSDSSPFMAEYEALLQRFSHDYNEVYHTNIGDEELRAFFAGGHCTLRTFANPYQLDFEQLLGRTMSASYMPSADSPEYFEVQSALQQLFSAHQEGGHVLYEYVTELYFGHLA